MFNQKLMWAENLFRRLSRWKLYRRSVYRYVSIALLCTFITVACVSRPESDSKVTAVEGAADSDVLTLWWEKGFVLEEDEALQKVVDTWQQQTGIPAKLSFYTTDDIARRAQRALQAGNPPDIMMSHIAAESTNPRLAWQGKLVDVSDVIAPIKDTYPAAALDSVHFYNNAEGKRSYYGVPVSQTAMYLFYWRDLVKQAGFDDRNFPQDWDQYWSEWQQVQDKLAQQGQAVYSLGFPLSIGSADADHFFEQVMEAFDVGVLDAEGRLQIDDPAVRQRVVQSLGWITRFYQQGYVPPDAIKWLSPDNNNSLLNRSVVMTPNATLSIPTAVEQDQDTYLHKLGTLELPNKPSGAPMRYVVSHRHAVVFADAPHNDAAKQFLSYLLQPGTLGAYLKAGKRNLPVTKPIWDDPYWTDPADPHRSVMSKVLLQGETRPFYPAYHPAYSVVVEEEVWTRAIHRILIEEVPVEQAANEAIDKVKQIFAQWQ